mmetsp:Transcript_12205/g.29654  ORF Transcript_12205/g.29654 Transcript_12205/m.29654 type:complete len:142 (-) Transcript_12205:752-1177(-)
MFGNLFGSSKKEPVTSTVSATSATRSADPQTTIVKLRENINNQEKREEHIQRKVDAMVKEAKTKMGKGDKKGGSFVNDSLDHKCFSVDQNHQLLTCTCTIFIFDSWFQSAGLDIDLILNTALFAIISIWCLFTTGFIRRGK